MLQEKLFLISHDVDNGRKESIWKKKEKRKVSLKTLSYGNSGNIYKIIIKVLIIYIYDNFFSFLFSIHNYTYFYIIHNFMNINFYFCHFPMQKKGKCFYLAYEGIYVYHYWTFIMHIRCYFRKKSRLEVLIEVTEMT